VSSANDAAERDPKNWTLEGSQDGQSWTVVDTQTNQSFAARFQTNVYEFSNSTAYSYYRLNVTLNNGGPIVQLSELQLSDGSNTPPTPRDIVPRGGGAPLGPINAQPAAGGAAS